MLLQTNQPFDYLICFIDTDTPKPQTNVRCSNGIVDHMHRYNETAPPAFEFCPSQGPGFSSGEGSGGLNIAGLLGSQSLFADLGIQQFSALGESGSPHDGGV